MTKSSDIYDLAGIIMQVIVLSTGVALVISWDAAIQPRLLALIILILLVLIYPMPERLSLRFGESNKLHGITQCLLLDIQHSVTEKSGYEDITKTDLIKKINQWEVQINKFGESFDEKYDTKAGALWSKIIDQIYLLTIIGSSALIGWLVSLAF